MGIIAIVIASGFIAYIIFCIKSEAQKVNDVANRLADLLGGKFYFETCSSWRSFPTIQCVVNGIEIKVRFLGFASGVRGSVPIADTILYLSCPVKVDGEFSIKKKKPGRFLNRKETILGDETFEEDFFDAAELEKFNQLMADMEMQKNLREILSIFEQIQLDDHEMAATRGGINFGSSDPAAFVKPIEKFAILANKLMASLG